MAELCDLQIHVNGQQSFFLSEEIISRFCGKIRKIIKQEKRRTQIRNSGIEIDDFPGGPDGFESVSRFCYNGGTITVTVSNVSLLHCTALFLGMTEKVSPGNLLHQTETFLDGMFDWSWSDIIACLKSCEPFFSYADSSGLVQKLLCSLLAKIAQNSDDVVNNWSSNSSSSSPDTPASGLFRLSSSELATKSLYSSSKSCWWFEEMTVLPPMVIEKFVKNLGAYGAENNSSVLTRFLLHYLKTNAGKKSKCGGNVSRPDYGGLADTAVYGVILMMGRKKSAFSFRGLFWVLRIVCDCGVGRDCRGGLERLIGGMLDQASLDDILVSGGRDGGVYDVNLVVRLIRLFVHNYANKLVSGQRMNKVGRLIDKYLGEIAPDQSLKISKFLGVAEGLPDSARDCFDGVYRAIDIYLESHPCLSLEERSRICKCLNYDRLSLEACKDLAKNPRIPPRIAVQALASQHPNKRLLTTTTGSKKEQFVASVTSTPLCKSTSSNSSSQMVFSKYYVGEVDNANTDERFSEDSNNNDSEEMRLNLQRMQWRMVELEKVCREMKGQMSRMGKSGSKVVATANPTTTTRPLPRLC